MKRFRYKNRRLFNRKYNKKESYNRRYKEPKTKNINKIMRS